MKKLILITFIISTLLSLVSCSEKSRISESQLFPGIELREFDKTEVQLSSVFIKHKIIKLEDREDCLIGGDQNKIIKKNGYFYIQSINEILIFGEDGKFIKSLSKMGEGPEEYDKILDFDVVIEHNELWISANHDIMRYSIDSLEFKGRINFPFFLNRFKYIGHDMCIARTPEDTVFKILNTNGETVSSFFKKDLAVSGLKPVSFLKINDKFVSQLGNTNQAVSYDPLTNDFEIIDIISPTNSLEDIGNAKHFYDKYGYMEFTGKLRENFYYISSFREVKKQVIMILCSPPGCWSMLLNNTNTQSVYKYFPFNESTIDNNIVPGANPLIFNTLICGESDNSFIFMIPNEDDTTEKNPSILEVYNISI